MYGKLIRHVVLPIVIRQQWECYNELKKTCRLPSEEIKEIQCNRLRPLVTHAYQNVHYYREKFNENGPYGSY